MMVDFEAVYGAMDEYLTGGLHPVGASANLHSPDGPDQPDEEPGWDPNQILADGADIEELALRYVRMNGRHGNQMWFRTVDDGGEERAAAANPGAEADEEAEVEMEVEYEETPEARDERYRNAEMDKVSEPDHWAMLRHGH